MKRVIYCQDAIEWLKAQEVLSGSSIVVSLPDISEFPQYTLAQWKEWFIQTAELVLSKCPPDGVVIFFQSDIKFEGEWVDKAYLCQKAAEAQRQHLIWHKIVCRAPAGVITFGRPAYSHLLCFSPTKRPDLSQSFADVISGGEKTWQRGMGLSACLAVAKYFKEQTNTQTVINPFCGLGSMLAAAAYYGLEGIGIEKSTKRAKKAEVLQISPDGKSWSL